MDRKYPASDGSLPCLFCRFQAHCPGPEASSFAFDKGLDTRTYYDMLKISRILWRGERNMFRIKKMVVMAIVLFSSALLSDSGVWGQPLGFSSSQTPQQPQRGALATATGRFVFGQISDSSKDQFMLDTVTGRLWRIAESGKVGVYLKSVPYRDEKGECSMLPAKISDSTPGD